MNKQFNDALKNYKKIQNPEDILISVSLYEI
jgi:hypothetical protein